MWAKTCCVTSRTALCVTAILKVCLNQWSVIWHIILLLFFFLLLCVHKVQRKIKKNNYIKAQTLLTTNVLNNGLLIICQFTLLRVLSNHQPGVDKHASQCSSSTLVQSAYDDTRLVPEVYEKKRFSATGLCNLFTVFIVEYYADYFAVMMCRHKAVKLVKLHYLTATGVTPLCQITSLIWHGKNRRCSDVFDMNDIMWKTGLK